MPIVPEGLPGSAMFPDSVTFEISAELGARRLSWVSMLICTNDGFTGLDSIKLPAHVGDEVTALTAGYDAGTEINTEDFADIVPPCQALVGVSSGEPGTGTSDPALAEGGVIHHHEGIVGGADLVPEVHGWDVDQPVAEVGRRAHRLMGQDGAADSDHWSAPATYPISRTRFATRRLSTDWCPNVNVSGSVGPIDRPAT